MKRLHSITAILLLILMTACGSLSADTEESLLSGEEMSSEETTLGNVAEADVRILDFGENEDFMFSGFSGNEQHFRWTDSETATVTFGAMTQEKDYVCRVIFGCVMPDFIFHDSVYPVYVMLNGNEETAEEIAIHPGESEFTFEIKGTELAESNTLSFKSELWTPSEYGSKDTRMLGISFDKVIIEPLERNEQISN